MIAAVFLSISRAPALDQKARMGSRTDISSIAFDTLFDVNQQQPYVERVLKSATNWTYTNWKGMTFGILFGATLLSLLRLLPLWRLPGNPFLAAVQGLIGGAPLGVCVNCATPIAQGLQRAGIRLETMFAVMTASPTLNLIVITMMLSLFPMQFVVIKLLVTVIFIALLIPCIVWLWTRFSPVQTTEIPDIATAPPRPDQIPPVADDSWLSAFQTSLVELFKNLIFILRITLPLMLLAGLLGALLIESVSLESIAKLPSDLSSYFLIAAVGTFLPVPIAFDVVITSVLLSVGLAPGLAMTLFFSLSIFSIFPALIIGRDISWKLSALFISIVVLFSVAAGLLTEEDHRLRVISENSDIAEGLARLDSNKANIPPPPPAKPPQHHAGLIAALNHASALCASTFDDTLPCLNKLLEKNSFGVPDKQLCHEMSELNQDLAASCWQKEKLTAQSKAAIREKNIQICTDFDCRMAYINANSHQPKVLALCRTEPDPVKSQLCRKVALYNRITYFRSNEACGSDLDDQELAFCHSEVEARIAMEQMDMDRCNSLSDSAAKQSCLIVITALKVKDQGENYDCRQLPGPAYIAACKKLQVRAGAIASQSVEACQVLNETESFNCQIDVIKVLVEKSGAESLGSLEIPDLALPASRTSQQEMLLDTQYEGEYRVLHQSDNVLVSVAPPVTRRSPTGQFERHLSEETNLRYSWDINATDMFEPFLYGKGIAAGDINKDGFPDLVVAFEQGIYVYLNTGQGQYGLVNTLIPDDNFNTFVAALVDINNDGWLDLFASAYGGKQIFYLNNPDKVDKADNRSGFGLSQPLVIPSDTPALAMAVAFGDLDQDSDLDMVVGRWSHGIERHFRTFQANNELWLNQSGGLERASLFDADPAGSTLSILLSDLNGDSILDIVTGNDRQVPDIFYFSSGVLEYFHPDISIISETSLNTMSYDTADFNNDLKLDIFSSDMTFTESGREDYCANMQALGTPEQKRRCHELTKINREVGDFNISWCQSLDASEQSECLAAAILKVAIRDRNPDLCDKIPAGFPGKQDYCLSTTNEIPANKDFDLSLYPPQLTTNKFLMSWGSRFLDVTEDIGVSRSNWSWNARGFDADNDGFQDILVGTGYGFGATDENDFTIDLQVFSNVFFHNDSGARFSHAERAFGLENFVNTSAYTLTDYDLDGDLDIIEYGQTTGLSILENRVSSNNTLSFSIDDQQGNRFCIGCKIIIKTESNNQIREIKSGGGFLSYDEPIAQFGIGKDDGATSIEVHWSTGEISMINHHFPANRRYRITRNRQ